MYKKNHLAKIVKRIVLRFLRCSTKAKAAVLTSNMRSNFKTTYLVKSWIPRTTACYRSDKKCRKSRSTLLKIQISRLKAHHLTKKLKSKNLNQAFKRTYKWVFIHNRHKCVIINLQKGQIRVITPPNFSLQFCNLEHRLQTKQDLQVDSLQCFTRNPTQQM